MLTPRIDDRVYMHVYIYIHAHVRMHMHNPHATPKLCAQGNCNENTKDTWTGTGHLFCKADPRLLDS